jgi:ribonuclease BN (tRNA processing enzyme)
VGAMRLTILGGSAAGANPGQGCSGYLVESGSTQVVMDLGTGTFPELRRHVDFRSIDAVVLSRLHLDHTLDVLALRYALAYNPVSPGRRLPLWLPPGGLDFLNRLATALSDPSEISHYFSVFDAREYDPEIVLWIGELHVQFQPTVHYIPCWATRVSNGGGRDLLYTADTGPTSDLASFSKGASVMIAEGSQGEMSQEPITTRGHLTPAEAGTLARNAGVGVLILSHLWAENDPLSAVEEAELAFGGRVILATPGFRLSWNQRLV